MANCKSVDKNDEKLVNDEVLSDFAHIVSTCMFLNREEIRQFLST